MPRIAYVKYNSWTEFKSSIVEELFDTGIFMDGIYLFRGQGSSDWSLKTSFDRWIQSFGLKNPIEYAHKLLGNFRKECEKLNVPEHHISDDVYMMSLGQHFGLPTRLLDWSQSPYVAAFFAFNDAFNELISLEEIMIGDVAIWALKKDSEVWGREQGVEIIEIPPSENYRSLNQEGAFTLSRTPFACLEEYVEKFGEGEIALYRFSIPKGEVKRAMADLASMGLTHTRLFPDISGSALAAKMRMILTIQF